MAHTAKPLRFWQEITLMLTFKIFVLFVIWAVWFSAPETARIDDQVVASKILSRQPDKDNEHDAIARTR